MTDDNYPAFAQPMEIALQDGEIVVMGPDGFSGSFTPDAAEVSARRILEVVAKFRAGDSNASPSED